MDRGAKPKYVAGEIEKLILSDDLRGISRLAPHLPSDFCKRAADLIVGNRPRAMLVTGFCVNGCPETDGPPGTVALADALLLMNFQVFLVTDPISFKALKAIAPRRAQCLEFPVAGHEESKELAAALIELHQPSVIGFIERPGFTEDRRYRNMRGVDITEHCAMTDYLLDHGIPSFGIADGGNEAGVGAYAEQIKQEGIYDRPALSVADEVVAASVCNWGALGIVAYLAIYRGRDLLPDLETEAARVRSLVRVGAVDGFSGRNEAKIDGRSLEDNLSLLGQLKDLVETVLGP